MELNNKRVINGWAMYDWANSVYSLVITSAIFPIYYNTVTTGTNGEDRIDFFGFEVINTVLYSYALSFSFLFVAVILPLLSGMADYSGNKKFFLKVFMYTGSLACIGLFFFTGGNVEWAIICSILASVGYSGGLVFYDAFLPEIASQDRFDQVSAKGYSLGYIGSVILLVINLVVITYHDFFGMDKGIATRSAFLMVGLWWIGFSQITFRRVPDYNYKKRPASTILTKGYQEIMKVIRLLSEMKMMKLYLLAFFFYNMGVQTVMYLAQSFGSKELKLPTDSLILTVLIIQLVAVGGAYLFAHISNLKGNIFTLKSMVIIWIFICGGAYFTTTEFEFFGLAFLVGMVMGGIQSLSRATFAKLIPTDSNDHASFFSFFDITFNLSIAFGTFTYGFIEQLYDSMRNSVLALMVFFVIGLALLLLVRIPGFETSKETSR